MELSKALLNWRDVPLYCRIMQNTIKIILRKVLLSRCIVELRPDGILCTTFNERGQRGTWYEYSECYMWGEW